MGHYDGLNAHLDRLHGGDLTPILPESLSLGIVATLDEKLLPVQTGYDAIALVPPEVPEVVHNIPWLDPTIPPEN
jgi:hypothetical protein